MFDMDLGGAALSWIGKFILGITALVAMLFAAPAPSARLPAADAPEGSAAPAVATTATSTVSQAPSAPSPAPAIPKKAAAAKPLSVAATPTPPAALPPEPSITPEELNTRARAAVVNILCTTAAGGLFEPVSGSGTFIDPRGVILTNAHVAQYFLLRDYPTPNNISCVIRTGSPAQATYTAEPLYISPQWIHDNPSEITGVDPTGTGENDFALLLVTGRTDPAASLPASFPYVPPSDTDPRRGDEMLLASYPAGFLSGIIIQNDLFLATAYATVTELYIFKAADTWVDVFSVPGTIVSQGGSSGGAALRSSDGTLAGIIVTSSSATTTGARDLHAISIAHIDHSLVAQGIRGGLGTLLSNDLPTEAADFNAHIAPVLEQEILQAIH